MSKYIRAAKNKSTPDDRVRGVSVANLAPIVCRAVFV